MRRPICLFFIISALLVPLTAGAQGIITTAAGGAPLSDGVPAVSARVPTPTGVASDAAGNLYVASMIGAVYMLDAAGQLTVLAGTGINGFSGDGGLATGARLNVPQGNVAVDVFGNVWIADTFNDRIRRVDAATGVITTVAGGGNPPDGLGDGGPATSAALNTPLDVAVDGLGNLLIADANNNRIRRVDAATQVITTVAGNGMFGFSGDGGPATIASLNFPNGVVFETASSFLISDALNNRIRRVAATGVINTIAGNGTPSFGGDGGPATMGGLNSPALIALDGSANLFIADFGNNRVRRVAAATQIITTVAGNGSFGFSGDGGPATAASLNAPSGVALDSAGNLFIADFANNRIRQVDAATGVINTIAGNGDIGDGGPATGAVLNFLADAVADTAGNLYIADQGNERIRRVDAATGVITTVAGNGAGTFSGDGGPATNASISCPQGVAVDAAGNVFIADTANNRIRRVDALTGIITTVAGNGTATFSGDGGPATMAGISRPRAVAVDTSGNLYISDFRNNRVRRVDATTQIITTVAGTGALGFSGDGGLATNATFRRPRQVALDNLGNLFIADQNNLRIRRVDATTQIITTVAGNGTAGFSGDGGPALSAAMNVPLGVAVDSSGNLLIADGNNNRIRRVDAATQIITTVAGSGPVGFGLGDFSGDGGPATTATLNFPRRVAVDGSGNLIIADTLNNRVRIVAAAP